MPDNYGIDSIFSGSTPIWIYIIIKITTNLLLRPSEFELRYFYFYVYRYNKPSEAVSVKVLYFNICSEIYMMSNMKFEI